MAMVNIGGSSSDFKIPGLVAKQNESVGKDRNIYEEQIKQWKKEGKDDEFIGAKIRHSQSITMNKQLMTPDEIMNKFGVKVGVDPYDKTAKSDYYGWQWEQPLAQKPYTQPMSLEDYARAAGLQMNSKPARQTALEELLDGMFDGSEKEQFLMDLGYEFFVDEKGFDSFRRGSTVWNKALDLENTFKKEVKIKFKNLLLTKQVLKFKL